MLTAAELAQMQAEAAESLPGAAVVQSGSLTSDSGGGNTETWTAAGTYACRLAPIRGDEREMGDRISPDADFLITLPGTVTVSTSQRILHGGGTFNVEAVRDRTWPVTTLVETVKQT